MKRVSWEIILAGLFFVAIAFYLLSQNTDNYEENEFAEAVPSEPVSPDKPSSIQIIDLKNLEGLAALEELEVLKELEKAEHLSKLKELAHLIPAETRDEFLTEIDKAIREFSNDEFSINFEAGDELIVVNREYSINEGSWGNTSPGIYTYLKEFDASSISSTSISTYGGSITIIGTNDSTAKFTVQASGEVSSIDELESKINTTAVFSDSEAIFNLEQLGSSNKQNIQLQTTLYIPETMELVTKTNGGHIESTNIKGDQIYETGGGHIKLHRVKGDVIAASGGGHITVEDADGDVTLKTEGGHLKVKKCTGDVALKTSGGNIELKEIGGEIVSSTQAGNISVYLSSLSDDITAETYAGNVQIYIPSDSKISVDLHASNEVELKGFSLDGERTKDKAKGNVNGGGPEIIAFSKYGKVSLIKND